jgi:hypothetical protein
MLFGKLLPYLLMACTPSSLLRIMKGASRAGSQLAVAVAAHAV